MAKAKRQTKTLLARKLKEPFLNGKNDPNYKSLLDSKVVSVISKIASPVSSPAEQAMALRSASLMLNDAKLRYIFLKEGLIKKVLKNSLVNVSEDAANEGVANEDVATEAYGLLNIAAMEEGYDVCIYLWRQGIITLIQSAIKKAYDYYSLLTNSEMRDTGSMVSLPLWDNYTESILSLLIRLASTNEEMFTGITKNITLLPEFTTSLIMYSLGDLASLDNGAHCPGESLRTTQSLFSTLCETLFIFTEANPSFISAIRAFPIDEILLHNNLPIASRVYLNGLKHNIAVEESIGGCELDQTVIVDILESLASTINDADLTKLTQGEVSSCTTAPMVDLGSHLHSTQQSIKGIEVAIELITAISESATIQISDIFDTGSDVEEDLFNPSIHVESVGKELTDEMIVKKILETHVTEDKIDSEEDYSNDSGEIRGREEEEKESEDIYESGNLEKNGPCEKSPETDLCQMRDNSVDSDRDSGESYLDIDQDMGIVKRFLQENILPLLLSLLETPIFISRTLTALSNLSWTLALQDPPRESWIQSSRFLWSKVYRYLFVENQDIDILCSTLGILGAICKTCSGDVPLDNGIVSFIISQASRLHNLLQDDDDSFINYMVRVSNCFTPLAMREGNSEVTEMIGDFYLDLIGQLPNIPADIVAEILDSLFKIFGDAKYDYDSKVYVGKQYNKKLAALLPKVKQMGKRIDKRHNLPLRMRSDEAALNLAGFISYKAKEQKSSLS